MQKPERSAYTPVDFTGWRTAGTLEISPRFQRRQVWTTSAKSFLIDTLILGFPVPPIYIRVVKKDRMKENKPISLPVREIVDGQQRITAVLEFMDNKFRLSKNIESPYVGKNFDELPDSARNAIEQYSFICEVFYGIEDRDILSIFARLNTNSVRLNAQELRNGKYFGPFKRTAYDIAFSHIVFWQNNRIFSDQAIARMQEVELTSELMIAMIDGIQDKKKSIDRFYQMYDNEFLGRDQIHQRFLNVIDEISEIGASAISKSAFRRTPLFYTLFLVIFHRIYGLPKADLYRRERSSSSDRLTLEERNGLERAIVLLSEMVNLGKTEHASEIPPEFNPFVTAALSQTDNIRPRLTRFQILYDLAFQ